MSDIAQAFSDRIVCQAVAAETSTRWPADPSWDDLLLVLFNDGVFPSPGVDYITKYLKKRGNTGQILPVAISGAAPIPPGPAEAFKALPYDSGAPGEHGRIVRRIGSMLGLRLQGRDAKIFLSHRASDGAKIAAQLARHMTDLGYRPWLDEAVEIDGDTMILPGSRAQQQIDTALAEASLVLLLDTPDALGSRWIKHEIDTADGLLLPILPVWFRATSDRRIGTRFSSLLSLQRWVEVPLPDVTSSEPLSEVQLNQIIHSAEEYLCEILRRKCRVPFLVQNEFQSKGFTWDVLDKHRFMYRSSKLHGSRLKTEVLNHCSIFEQIYEPALKVFCKFLENASWAQFPLFVYDGDLLPDQVLSEIVKARADDRVIILHHQELANLIGSHFTVLGGA